MNELFFPARTEDDIPLIQLSFLNSQGVFLSWDRTNTTGVSAYNIYSSEQFDGNYEYLTSVPWPVNELIDSGGHPSLYYKIEEIGDSGTTLTTSQPFIGEELLIKASLAFQLKDLLRIPVYDEEGIFLRSRQMAKFAYTNWNYWPRPEVRITSSATDGDQDPYKILSETIPITATTSSTINYPSGLKYKLNYQGNVYFIDQSDNYTAINQYDTVWASYNVRLFTNQEMNDALNMALHQINSQPGANKYQTISQAPFYYDPALVAGACYWLIRGLLVRLTQRETRLLIYDPNYDAGGGGSDTISNLREMLRTYKEDFDALLKTLPKARYPDTKAIITPEYMMPGGRSRMFRYLWRGDG